MKKFKFIVEKITHIEHIIEAKSVHEAYAKIIDSVYNTKDQHPSKEYDDEFNIIEDEEIE